MSDTKMPSLREIDARLRAGVVTSLDKVVVNQTLSRVWRRYLTPFEFALLVHIVDRTLGWGKPSFTASAHNILDGTEKYAGVGISERAHFNALKKLETLGVISRSTRVGERTRFTLHVSWEQEASSKQHNEQARTEVTCQCKICTGSAPFLG